MPKWTRTACSHFGGGVGGLEDPSSFSEVRSMTLSSSLSLPPHRSTTSESSPVAASDAKMSHTSLPRQSTSANRAPTGTSAPSTLARRQPTSLRAFRAFFLAPGPSTMFYFGETPQSAVAAIFYAETHLELGLRHFAGSVKLWYHCYEILAAPAPSVARAAKKRTAALC